MASVCLTALASTLIVAYCYRICRLRHVMRAVKPWLELS